MLGRSRAPIPREESIIEALERIRLMINDNNEQQISNMQVTHINLKLLLDYALKGIVSLVDSLEQHRNIHKQIVGIIRNHGLQHLLTHQLKEPPRNVQLEELNSKITELILDNSQQPGLKGMENLMTLDGRAGERRGLGGTAEKAKKAMRERASLEFKLAIKYVNEHLAQTMDASDGDALLPKSVILNLFVHWNQQRGYELDRAHLNVLQMALTNELKRKFPTATHNSTFFKGLRFRPEYKHLIKLADNSNQPPESVPIQEDNNSERNLEFEDDYMVEE